MFFNNARLIHKDCQRSLVNHGLLSVLLILTHCLLLLPWCVGVLCLVHVSLCSNVTSVISRESWLLYFNVFLMTCICWCSVAITRDAICWSAVCDSGIPWSYSLTFLEIFSGHKSVKRLLLKYFVDKVKCVPNYCIDIHGLHPCVKTYLNTAISQITYNVGPPTAHQRNAIQWRIASGCW